MVDLRYRRFCGFTICLSSLVLWIGSLILLTGFLSGCQLVRNIFDIPAETEIAPIDQVSPMLSAQLCYQTAEGYLEKKEFNKAIDWFEETIHRDPTTNTKVLPKLAKLYAESNQPKKSIAIYEQLLRQRANDADWNKEAGEEYFKLKDYAHALSCFQRAAISIGNDLTVKERIAICQFHGHQIKECFKTFQSYLTEAESYFNLGLLYWKAVTLPDYQICAEDCFAKAIVSDPELKVAQEAMEQLKKSIPVKKESEMKVSKTENMD